MAKDKSREILRSEGGFFRDVSDHIKLIFRLMADSRVPGLYKLLPIGSLLYVLVPDLVPGPLDDGLVIWLGSSFFVELCPPEIVEEHMREIRGTVRNGNADFARGDEDIIEGEFRDL